MGLQSELPPHREVIETSCICRLRDTFRSELPPHREVIETSILEVLAENIRVMSELPPHREVFDPNPRDPKKISGICLCKKLKKLACPGIDSERW